MQARSRFAARLLTWLGILVLIIALAGCLGGGTSSTASLLPGSDVVSGWQMENQAVTYKEDNLFDLVNGQAESFFAYGFEQAVVAQYTNATGDRLRIEIFQLASPADAYGLFSVSRSGEPFAIGVDGETDPGRRLAFWQDRFYVRILAPQAVDDEILSSFGQAAAGALPPGDEEPAIIQDLPPDGLQLLSIRYFHQELSIQNWLWLGGTNLLGLSQDTQGILADYQRGGSGRLLLIVYPENSQALAAGEALKTGDVSDVVVVDVKDNKLGAVLGDIQQSAAENLLKEVLK